MTVRQLERTMAAREFDEWVEYYQTEPWGEERADLRAGMIAAPLMNMWTKKGGRKAKPSQWLMKFGRRKAQSVEDMKLVAQMYTAHWHNTAAAKGKPPPPQEPKRDT